MAIGGYRKLCAAGVLATLATVLAGHSAMAGVVIAVARIDRGLLLVNGTSPTGTTVQMDLFDPVPIDPVTRQFSISAVYVPADCIVDLEISGSPIIRTSAVIANCAPANLIPQGNWDTAKTYYLNDLVYFMGSTYRAINPGPLVNRATPPGGTNWQNYWQLFASKGANGLQGAQGPAGAAGAAGPQGAAGADGVTGLQGDRGARGLQGLQGDAGPQGQIGLTGADGAVGAAGPQGARGVKGDQGNVGPQGTIGLTGPAGADGAIGPQGPVGADGAIGPQGDRGARGAAGLQGALGPIGLTGPAGDAGPQGQIGLTGADGAVGAAGPQGARGVKGDQGNVGPQGTIGLTGPAGAVGPQGVAGASGATGPQGPVGTGIGGHGIVTAASASNSSNKSVTVSCGTGKVVLGGGALMPAGFEGNLAIYSTYPSAANAWTVQAVENDAINSNWSFTAYAVCATQ